MCVFIYVDITHMFVYIIMVTKNSDSIYILTYQAVS